MANVDCKSILDPQTEETLVRRWQDHQDTRARERLLAAHQGLVHRWARKYRSQGCAEIDLVQEGNLGFLHALDRFDSARGARLATFCTWWVRAHMLRFLERNARMVRGATTQARQRLFYRLARTKEALARDDGATPSTDVLATALGVSKADVLAMDLLQSPTASLDAPANTSERDGSTRLDGLCDPAQTPEEGVAAAELGARLDAALHEYQAQLQGRALEMFRERIVSTRPTTLQELSQRWGVTRATARRIEQRVATPLRRHLYRRMGDSITATLGHV